VREEVVGGWRRLHNEELHNFYSSPDIRVKKSRRMRWAGQVAHMGAIKNTYNIFVGRLERKGPVRRPKCTWEGNIGMGVRKIGWEVVNWIHLALDMDQWWALVNMVMNLHAP